MSIRNIIWHLFIYALVGECLLSTQAIHLAAYFSSEGIHGQVSFYQDPDEGQKPIHLKVDLVNKKQFDGNQTWTWFVSKFPVDYSKLKDRCDSKYIGEVIADLGDLFGPIAFVSNESVYFEFESTKDDFALAGAKGVWGRSLVLLGPDQKKVCGTITVVDEREEWVAEARFRDGVVGSVLFRWVGSIKNNLTDNIIFSNLVHSRNSTKTENLWKIYITDILDSKADQSRANCDFLQILFNPGDAEEPMGDLSKRLGPITVGTMVGEDTNAPQSFFTNTGLSLLPADLSSRRSLYLVIFDDKHKDSFLSCAKIRFHRSVVLKAIIQSKGVKGSITLSQRTQYYPTLVIFNISSLEESQDLDVELEIREIPPNPNQIQNICNTTKLVYNPLKLMDSVSGTQDSFAVGNLQGKYGKLQFIDKYTTVWDSFLPLYGLYSVAHRTIHINRNIDGYGVKPWICSILHRYQSINSQQAVTMITAQAQFRYPLVGTIVFRQPTDQPWVDTTILVEKLVHSDGMTGNNSFNHRWSINENPPGKDFYNWTMRCLSSGSIFNPHDVDFNQSKEFEYCNPDKSLTCRLGDLSRRLGGLSIAGSRIFAANVSTFLFTDSSLSLSGVDSIIGKSLVIYDDHGPVARGERLACSKIFRQYNRKAVVKNWFGNGKKSPVTGKIEFLQQSKYDVTNIDASIEGLEDTISFKIHSAPVQEELLFPCEESTLYKTYNIGDIPSQTSPLEGTPDQYKTGDLSGKFGTLENKTFLNNAYNDSTLTLYGPLSFMGRSLIIHKKGKSSRWACTSIERGYAPSEASELRAIASFHNPNGYAYGYVRMTQLVYRDGSMSDTIIEVNLRYPGQNDRNHTKNHNWAIYVNSVSVDATVQILNVRCTAAGYMWNPYYTQLADPLNEELYKAECSPENPLRCYVGDLSSRIGTIDIGGKRQIFTDGSFPLGGQPVLSAMNRAIVVFTPNRGSDRMACANIEPDKDIIKYANIRTSPGFVGDLFLQEFRDIMGIPEWYMTVDTRQTKLLYQGNCMQFLLHFKGPDAGKLELDFSRLLSTGTLAEPSIFIPGYIRAKRKSKTSYRPCGNEDPLESSTNKKKNYYYSSNVKLNPSSVTITYFLFLLLLFNP